MILISCGCGICVAQSPISHDIMGGMNYSGGDVNSYVQSLQASKQQWEEKLSDLQLQLNQHGSSASRPYYISEDDWYKEEEYLRASIRDAETNIRILNGQIGDAKRQQELLKQELKKQQQTIEDAKRKAEEEAKRAAEKAKKKAEEEAKRAAEKAKKKAAAAAKKKAEQEAAIEQQRQEDEARDRQRQADFQLDYENNRRASQGKYDQRKKQAIANSKACEEGNVASDGIRPKGSGVSTSGMNLDMRIGSTSRGATQPINISGLFQNKKNGEPSSTGAPQPEETDGTQEMIDAMNMKYGSF